MSRNISKRSNHIFKFGEGLFLKTFLAIVIAYVLTFICVTALMRPVMMEEGVVAHMSVDFLQDMLNAKLRGKSSNDISDYLKHQKENFLNGAQIATYNELLAANAPQRFGLTLQDTERLKILEGKAFWTGRPQNHFFGPPKHEPKLFFFAPPPPPDRRPPREKQYRKHPPEIPHTLTIQTLVIYTQGLMTYRPRPPRGDKHSSYAVIPIANTPYVIFSRHPAPTPPEISTLSLTLNSALILCILLCTAFVLIYPIVRRIRRIQAVCQSVSNGNYSARCNDKRNDSIGTLAVHIDDMTASIERHLGQQKSLLQAVSHELRTPLSRIRFSIEMLDIPDDDEKSIARLDSIDEDLTEIDNLIKELGYFNYVDAGKGKQHFEITAVQDLIDMTIHQRSLAIHDFDVTTHGIEEDMSIEADPTAFKRVIGNLLSNAARYAKEKIQIQVCYSKDKKHIEICVDDDGPGIPEDKRLTIFEPFVCLEKSRSKSMTGCGLGLAIADRIMRVHCGSIEALTSPLGGTRMLTIWPVTQPKPL